MWQRLRDFIYRRFHPDTCWCGTLLPEDTVGNFCSEKCMLDWGL